MGLPLADSAVRAAAVLEHDETGRLRFSHDLFRDVLYDGLSAARRSALHLSVADLLRAARRRGGDRLPPRHGMAAW